MRVRGCLALRLEGRKGKDMSDLQIEQETSALRGELYDTLISALEPLFRANRERAGIKIEPTGLNGWMAYRYQYKVENIDRFGYAETEEEALENIKKALS